MRTYSFSNLTFLFFAGWGILALLLAWGGIFYAPLFFVYTILFISTLFTFILKKRNILHSIPQEPILSQAITGSIFSRAITWNRPYAHLYFLALLAFFLASFFQPVTYFSGRDEGSIFQASFELAGTHSLTFSSPESRAFFDIYGQGRALNFPGFYYTDTGSLTTQFPIAGIAWYASFLSLFGLMGLPLANAVLLFLFFLAFTRIAQTYASPSWILYGIVALATSLPIFWFSRFTLSENFALAFVWIFILATTALLSKPTPEKFLLWFLCGILLLFGRIEGIAFFLVSLLILLWSKPTREFFFTHSKKYILLPLILLFIFGIISLFVSTPFYITIAKGFLEGSSEAIHNAETFFLSLINRFRLLFLYGIGASLIMGLFGIRLLFQKRWTLQPIMVALLIASPSFLYLFVSFISPDHPWMFRRIAFSVVPIFLLLSLFAFSALAKTHKKTAVFFATLLLLSQGSAFFYFFPIVQGKDQLAFTQTLSQNIPDNELLLVDQLASGDGFRMFPATLSTLFNKHAVYFMNPYDLDDLDLSHFSSVSLLVPEGREDLYTPILREHTAEKVFSFPLTVSALEHSDMTSRQFPELVTTKQNVLLYRWTGEVK